MRLLEIFLPCILNSRSLWCPPSLQVVSCLCEEDKEGSSGLVEASAAGGPPKTFAVKVIKNQPAYYHQVWD